MEVFGFMGNSTTKKEKFALCKLLSVLRSRMSKYWIDVDKMQPESWFRYEREILQHSGKKCFKIAVLVRANK